MLFNSAPNLMDVMASNLIVFDVLGPNSNGLQPNSDGLQATSDVLQPKSNGPV